MLKKIRITKKKKEKRKKSTLRAWKRCIKREKKKKKAYFLLQYNMQGWIKNSTNLLIKKIKEIH